MSCHRPLLARSVTFFGNIHSLLYHCMFNHTTIRNSNAANTCRISGHKFIRTLGTIRFTAVPNGNRCTALLSPLLCACVPMHYHVDIAYQLPDAGPEDTTRAPKPFVLLQLWRCVSSHSALVHAASRVIDQWLRIPNTLCCVWISTVILGLKRLVTNFASLYRWFWHTLCPTDPRW